MLVKDQSGIVIEIKGDPFSLSRDWHYFPATNVLVHWKDSSNFLRLYKAGFPSDTPAFQTEEDFMFWCDFYSMVSREESLQALKKLSESRFQDGRHDVSFKMRQLLNI